MTARKRAGQTRFPARRREVVRHVQRRFVLSVEGRKTEPQYFRALGCLDSTNHIHVIQGDDKSSPRNVLARMGSYLKSNPLEKGDEAWLVVDNDSRHKRDFDELLSWERCDKRHHIAFSWPCFELWLLLHFERARVSAKDSIRKRLRMYMPDYEKSPDMRKICPQHIRQAIHRAKLEDKDYNDPLPWGHRITTVYRLVEKLSLPEGN